MIFFKNIYEVICIINLKNTLFKGFTRGGPWVPPLMKQNFNRTQTPKYLQREDGMGGLVRTQNVCTYTYIRIHTYVYIHTCTYIRVYVYTCFYVRVSIHICGMFIYIYTHTHTTTHKTYKHTHVCVCMSVSVCVSVSVYIYRPRCGGPSRNMTK